VFVSHVEVVKAPHCVLFRCIVPSCDCAKYQSKTSPENQSTANTLAAKHHWAVQQQAGLVVLRALLNSPQL
jgi:hypothetical protein